MPDEVREESADEMDESLRRAIVLSVAEGLLRSGEVETANRTVHEVREELLSKLREFAADEEGGLPATIDRRGDLLQEASRLLGEDKPLIACLLYATWLEHWLNQMVFSAGGRRGTDYADLVRRVQRTSFAKKIDELLPELGVPVIEQSHSNLMKQVQRLRNEYVHYKWESHDIDSDVIERADEELEEALSGIDATVRYLVDLEESQLFPGGREQLLKLLGYEPEYQPPA